MLPKKHTADDCFRGQHLPFIHPAIDAAVKNIGKLAKGQQRQRGA